MITSESISKIAPALLTAQRAITFAVKDAKNPHFKSTYADLSSVIDAVKPALNEAGIVFLQMPAPSDRDSLALTTRLVHESGEWIESTATCPLQKSDPQGYGSAVTYLKRYSLASAVGLYQEDDDGNAASKGSNNNVRPLVTGARSGIGEDLPQDWKDYLKDLAQEATDFVKAGDLASALEAINRTVLEADQRTYLENQLDSKTRSALKQTPKGAQQ
ncbi:ERF family protein [Variovorax paradoxus]|nr:ERF family protein [Variovorax paradoxus]MBT2300410.1 ERF family protein [Variovorax paradoxus]